MRFGAFVITFNRSQILKQTLEQIFLQTRPPDSILVVDNGNSRETKEIVETFSRNGSVRYHPMEENVGPAGAAAYAIGRLASEGYDWIYWGDEDDPPRFPETLKRVLTVAENADTDIAGVGAVGALFSWRTGESVRLSDESLKGNVSVDTIGGNSQFILRKEAVQAVGVPDARLFFGHYEREYCLRVRKAGYRFLVDGELMWKHREIAGRLHLKLSKHLVSEYPFDLIWRRYYRTRNYIFMMNNTFQRPDLAARETLKALGRVLFVWVRGLKYGIRFTRLQLQAIWDGYRGRMGRTVLPTPKVGI